MDPADLMTLATPRGIDLNQIGGVASDLKGEARKRTLTLKEKEDGIREVQETVKARETRTYKQPTFTVAELGQAGAGLGPIPWAAALYSFAGSQRDYWLLWTALGQNAFRLARRDRWEPRVIDRAGTLRFYWVELAELVLLEDANWQMFRSRPNIYSDWINVTPQIWEKHCDSPYRSLKDIYSGWLGTARRTIGRWIRNDVDKRE